MFSGVISKISSSLIVNLTFTNTYNRPREFIKSNPIIDMQSFIYSKVIFSSISILKSTKIAVKALQISLKSAKIGNKTLKSPNTYLDSNNISITCKKGHANWRLRGKAILFVKVFGLNSTLLYSYLSAL